jgi:hypothetical protein
MAFLYTFLIKYLQIASLSKVPIFRADMAGMAQKNPRQFSLTGADL